MLPGKHAILAVFSLTLVWTLSLCGVAAWAQSPVDDVHVKPRVQPPPPPSQQNEILDPSLRTHTKPFKTNVDLVLVPVTITDPMNRLVTGLDKDNFSLFEGKDRQEIRHFSSEDARVSRGDLRHERQHEQQDRAGARSSGGIFQDCQPARRVLHDYVRR